MILDTKLIVVTFITLGLLAIVIVLYIKQLPPFFNPPTVCTPATALTCGTNVGYTDTFSGQTEMASAPLRYQFDILGSDGTMPGADPNGPAGLVQMAISLKGGWNASTYNYFKTSDIVVKDGFENPLVMNGQYYITNAAGWLFTDDNRKLHARFALCNLLQIDTTAYIFDDEACLVNGKVVSPPTATSGCMRYQPAIMPLKSSLDSALQGGGTLIGTFGYCDTQTYKLQKFMRYGGFLIPIVLFVAIGAFLIFYNTRKTTSPSETTDGTEMSTK